ncbi:MAG TPA: PIN domain-containing protein [Bryobacteraceae bacterium]|nr:PIN domain-containing protein [Bryobacteraceae bacterium]
MQGLRLSTPGFLLDTNVLIWLLAGDERKISRRAHRALSAPQAEFRVSIVSVWELVLKRQTGRLRSSETTDSIVALVGSSGSVEYPAA